jgi:hypothetical protein
MSAQDDELERLLSELAPTSEARAELLEAHRLLEKDLSRLGDPLPPPDFLQNVMAKVAAEPARSMSRSELVNGIGVAVISAVAAAVAVWSDGAAASMLGTGLALVRDGGAALGSGLAALWRGAPLPMSVGLSLSFMLSLVLMRRIGQAPTEMKVS